MKRQTLLLVLVAVMSLAGATEAFCQRPQRSKVRVKPKMDYRVKESAKANPIEEFLAEHGPHAGGNPGPFLPGAEVEELVTDIMVDILLDQQFGLEDYKNYLITIQFFMMWLIMVMVLKRSYLLWNKIFQRSPLE